MTSYPWLKKIKKAQNQKKVSRIVVVERARRRPLVTLRELRSPNKEQIQVKKREARLDLTILSFLLVQAGCRSLLHPELESSALSSLKQADIENYLPEKADIGNYLT